MKLKNIVFTGFITIIIVSLVILVIKGCGKYQIILEDITSINNTNNIENVSTPKESESFARNSSYKKRASFDLKDKTYIIEDLGYLTNENKRNTGSFRINRNKIIFFYDGYQSNGTGMCIYNLKNNTFEEIKEAKGNPSTDYTNAIELENGKILLSGHRTAIFNPLTKKITRNNDWITGRDFHTVQKDNNSVLRFLPDSKPICFGYPGGCTLGEEYIVVLATDLKKGTYKEINRIKTNSRLFDRIHITLDKNRVLSYTLGMACDLSDMELFLYDISKNKYTKLKEIKEIGYSDTVVAQKLKNGYILFTGGTNQCSKEYDEGKKKYLDSIVYNPNNNKIIKRTKMLFNPIDSFYGVRLIPLDTGDILVLENGLIRQYFDIYDLKFKPLEKEIQLYTQGKENITAVDKDTIIISHGIAETKKHAGLGNTTQIYILYTGNKNNHTQKLVKKRLEQKLFKKRPALKIPENTTKKINNNLENVHMISVYKSSKKVSEESYNHPEGIIDLKVTIKSKPINLFLSSYEPIVWKIKTEPNVKINKIYISSHHKNRVEGVDAPVETIEKNLYIDKQKIYLLKETFNKKVETFQDKNNKTEFIIDGQAGKNFEEFTKHKPIGINEPVLFTNNSLTAQYSGFGASTTLYTNKYVTKGKYYFEMQIKYAPNAHTTFNNVGIISPDQYKICSFTYPIDEGDCFYASPEAINDLRNNDIVGIAFDMDNGYLFYSINGVWNEEGIKFRNDGREYSPAAEVMEGSKWKANFGAKNFKYPIPKGYKAFDK